MMRFIHARDGLSGKALVLLALTFATASCGVDEHSKAAKILPPKVSAPDRSPTPTRHSWPEASYLEVRAYHSREPFLSSFESGIPEQVGDKNGVLLNADQRRRLISAVVAERPPYGAADCWFPRNAFVFWDSSGKPVAEVDICFDCFQVKGGPSGFPDINALADLVNDLGLPIGTGVDVKEFRKAFDSIQEAYQKSQKEVAAPGATGRKPY